MMRGNSVWEKLRSIARCNIQESEDRVSRKLQVSYFWRNQVFEIFLKSFLNDSKLDFYSFFSRKVPSSYSKWQIAEIFFQFPLLTQLFFRMPHWKANSWSLKRRQRSLQAALICYICCQNRNTTHFWHYRIHIGLNILKDWATLRPILPNLAKSIPILPIIAQYILI